MKLTPNDRIRTDLCYNHFDRVMSGETCSVCPSNIANEKSIMAVSKVLSLNEDGDTHVIIEALNAKRSHDIVINWVKNGIIGVGILGLFNLILLVITLWLAV